MTMKDSHESRTPRWYDGARNAAKTITRRGRTLGAIAALSSIGLASCDEPIGIDCVDCVDEPEASFVYMAGADVPAGVGIPDQESMYALCVVDGQVLEDNTGLITSTEFNNSDTCMREVSAANVDGNASPDGEDVYEATNSFLEVTAAEDPALLGARFWTRVRALGPDMEPASFKVGDAAYVEIVPARFADDATGIAARTGAGQDFVPGWRDWNGTIHTSPDTMSIDGAPIESYDSWRELGQDSTITPYAAVSREEAASLVGEQALAAREAAFTPTIEDQQDTIWIATTKIPAGYAVRETGEWGLMAAELDLTLEDGVRGDFLDITPEGDWRYMTGGVGVPFGAYNVQQKMTGEFEGQLMENVAYIARVGGSEPTLIMGRPNSGDATEGHLAVTQGVWSTGVSGLFRQGAGARLGNGTESFATNGTLAATYNNTVSSPAPDHLRYPLSEAPGKSLTFWTELKEDMIEQGPRIVSREYVTEHGGQ